MVNASLNWFKTFLTSRVKNLSFSVALIFGIHVLDGGEFLTGSLALPPTPLTNLLLSALNVFGADHLNDPVVFNIAVNDTAILLKQ